MLSPNGRRRSHRAVERGLLLLPDSKTGKKTIVLNAPALAVLASLPRMGITSLPGKIWTGRVPIFTGRGSCFAAALGSLVCAFTTCATRSRRSALAAVLGFLSSAGC